MHSLAETVFDLVSVEGSSEPTGELPLVITPGRTPSRPPLSLFSVVSAEPRAVAGRSMGAKSAFACLAVARPAFASRPIIPPSAFSEYARGSNTPSLRGVDELRDEA